ncbi:MAG: terpene cyclase/mutase family protein, partial [Planctomycetes bacterium]|nr:terpene cyclase/mutase family protein [Planctomycetota bacterium]
MTRPVVLLVFAASLLTFSAGTDAAPADPGAPPKVEPKKGGGFEGRTKEGKARLLKEFGGSIEGEEAVMLGLAWLVQMQKPDGNWQYDGGPHRNDLAAATGMAVLAFTGAGQSHKEGRYKQTVQAGVDWLVANVDMSQGGERGKFRTITNMYSQGIASLALIEAYGMTKDPKLRDAAQAAVDYIQKAQGRNGSWGYTAGTDNDTSILGWQIQALHAAQLTQDLVVDQKVIDKAIKFLDYVSGRGQNKSTYGYGGPPGQPATALTAIGLLCRYYVDGWRRDTAGFAEGSKGLMRRALTPTTGRQVDLYYYCYATQVVRFYGGEEWKTWNEGPE